MTLLELLFALHVSLQDDKMNKDHHMMRCKHFKINALSLTTLFIDTPPLGSDNENPRSLTAYITMGGIDIAKVS